MPNEYITKYNWSNNSAVLSLEDFKEQMGFLYDNGFYTATLDELEQGIFENEIGANILNI
ncbi:MAG: hypothetical protein PHY91_09335 [Tissierellia bacterium]|nr:hypothetical protein [Tissierellia bacterium]MDD2447859.1 hypothetical protein [Tissierellia bacterium]MDD4727118.1 hypothetical protein [Tissierellia bacterium]